MALGVKLGPRHAAALEVDLEQLDHVNVLLVANAVNVGKLAAANPLRRAVLKCRVDLADQVTLVNRDRRVLIWWKRGGLVFFSQKKRRKFILISCSILLIADIVIPPNPATPRSTPPRPSCLPM